MSTSMTVTHAGGDRFEIGVRGHVIAVDQPIDAGGEDSAPTPVEVFVAGLAGCVAFYAHRYCARHDIDVAGLSVDADFVIGGRPTHVESVDVRLRPPDAMPTERRDALLAVASGCTVHNTLTEGTTVAIGLV